MIATAARTKTVRGEVTQSTLLMTQAATTPVISGFCVSKTRTKNEYMCGRQYDTGGWKGEAATGRLTAGVVVDF